jgi:hypothetical protein
VEIAMPAGQYDQQDLERFDAVLDAAAEEARRLGVGFDSPDDAFWLKTRMAAAIFGGAALGERDPARLKAQAVAMVLDQGMTVTGVPPLSDDPQLRERRPALSVATR